MVVVKILFFASAREAVDGLWSLDLELEEQQPSATTEPPASGCCDTAQLRQVLATKFPNLASFVLNEEYLTLALNEEYVLPGQVVPLKNGDTVALIPPISGG
ncbi:hypothetical protein ACA910_008109 [Epithemia clementina (nom. ined.)]